MTRTGRVRILAWTLGAAGALACAVALLWTIALGIYLPLAVVNLTLIVTGLLGALVASRRPQNSVGWLMCIGSLAGSLAFLPLDYAYTALVVEHGSWPLGHSALWFAAWAYAPSLGLFFPTLTVRFPDGNVPPRWRIVDWLAVAGTVVYAISVALAPREVLRGFVPSQARTFQLLAPFFQNPLGAPVPESVLGQARLGALVLILLAFVAAVAAVIDRFRTAHGDERLQLKWFAYAGALMAAALIYGVVVALVQDGLARLVVGRSLGDALIPLTYSFFAFPLAIGVAILRYRLYDIDLIINRSVVYGGTTAILAALYTAGITLFQRLFISVSGQKSDAAYVLTAFAVVVAFSPLKDWVQKQADRRLARQAPSAVLARFRADVEAVVAVMDVHRVAFRLVDQAADAFDARGAALYLHATDVDHPAYSRGHLNGAAAVEVHLRHEAQEVGRLVMGTRRGNITYTERDRRDLQTCADSVAEALVLAARLGHREP